MKTLPTLTATLALLLVLAPVTVAGEALDYDDPCCVDAVWTQDAGEWLLCEYKERRPDRIVWRMVAVRKNACRTEAAPDRGGLKREFRRLNHSGHDS